MIFAGSRYEKAGTMVLVRPDGSRVSILRTPLPRESSCERIFSAVGGPAIGSYR